MSATGIYALILTVLFVIYIGVVVTQDIIAIKKKAMANDNVEEFDSSFATEDESVTVSQGADGIVMTPREDESVINANRNVPAAVAESRAKEAGAEAVLEKETASAKVQILISEDMKRQQDKEDVEKKVNDTNGSLDSHEEEIQEAEPGMDHELLLDFLVNDGCDIENIMHTKKSLS